MAWDDELAELARRRDMVREMGGPESVAFQHSRGKLTVSERLDLLANPGSLREFGGLSGTGTYDEDGDPIMLSPRGEVSAVCLIGRRLVAS